MTEGYIQNLRASLPFINYVLMSYTVVVSVDCLTALVRDIESIVPLGLHLGFEDDTLQAIQSYYNQDEKSLMFSHMINMWLFRSPENMIQQLRDALNHLKKNEISQQLTLLSSLGKNNHVCCADGFNTFWTKHACNIIAIKFTDILI